MSQGEEVVALVAAIEGTDAGGGGEMEGGLSRQSSSAALISTLSRGLSRSLSSRASSLAMQSSSNMNRKVLSDGVPFGSVIHFTTHSVAPMVLKPWKVGDPQTSTGTGFFLGNKTIITNSHVVHNHTSIRLERHGQPGNFAGTVLCESALCDLALVTVEDESFWADVPAVTLQDSVPELDDTVVAVGYPLGAKSVTVTRGVVSNVALKDLSLQRRNPQQLTVQIDAAINPGNSGGPVFNVETCEVVGVAFAGLDSAEGHGFIIPVPVIRLFMATFKQAKNPLWGLLPSLGIAADGLVNPAMRKSCFGGTLPPHRDGCLITAVAKHSTADGLLKCGDILLTIDGHTVSEKCDVQFRGQERLPFTYLVTRKPCGAEVKVKALRSRRIVATAEEAQPPVEDVVDAEGTVEDGVARATEVELTMRLKPTPYLVPKVLDLDYFATYIIVGGLVILPAGRPLQDAAIKTRRYSLYDACETIAGTIAFSELDMQGCILSDVMAHSINVSYDEMVGQVVSAVNGEPVKNMRHLAQLLQAATADDLVLDFRVPKDGEMRSFLVFDRAEALACTEEILVQNKVPAWCSPSLLEE